MLITPLFLDIISFVYGIYAIVTLYNVVKNRVSFFDSRITSEDARLAGAFAFSFLWPPAVLLHEWGHWIVAKNFGATGLRLEFFFYWGEITYTPGSIGLRQDWWVALAGNAVTYALGFIGLAAARLPSLRTPIWRVILFSFASNQLFVVLLWYPALCIFGAFYGDFTVIYGKPYWWLGSQVVAFIDVMTLIGYGWVNYTDGGKTWARNYLWGPALNESRTQQEETRKDETQ